MENGGTSSAAHCAKSAIDFADQIAHICSDLNAAVELQNLNVKGSNIAWTKNMDRILGGKRPTSSIPYSSPFSLVNATRENLFIVWLREALMPLTEMKVVKVLDDTDFFPPTSHF